MKFVIFLLIASSTFGLENSVIPLIEKFEQIENVSARKLGAQQLLEIREALSRKSEKIRVVTYNILFTTQDDELESTYRWPKRMPRFLKVLEEMQPDVLGVQEMLAGQLKDLTPRLEGIYAFYGRQGDNDEINGIFYRKERFELIDSYVWYINKNTLTMVKLRDLKTDKVFAVFNTHMIFADIDKRQSQAVFIAETIEPIAAEMPTLFMGDLNTFPERFDLTKLPFYDGDYILRTLTKGALVDSQNQALLGHLGPLSSFSNHPDDTYAFEGMGTPGVILDHILVTDNIDVLIHAIQPALVDGRYASDHFPVIVDVILN